MIRRIALTLGMGVAVMSTGSRMTPSRTVVDSPRALEVAAGAKPVAPKIPRTLHRSGYIVASS